MKELGIGPYAGMRAAPQIQQHPLQQLQDPQGMIYPNFPMGNRAMRFLIFIIIYLAFSSQLPVPIHMFSSFVPAPPPMPPMPPLPVPLNAIHLTGGGIRNNQQTRKKTRRQTPKQGSMFNSQVSQQDIPLASISQVSQGFSQSTYDGITI